MVIIRITHFGVESLVTEAPPFKSEPLARIGVAFKDEVCGLPGLGLPIFPHNLWAAGVRPPETRGLDGNLGTGVLSNFPVNPFFADSLLECAARSTRR